jgi:hypothetical protein
MKEERPVEYQRMAEAGRLELEAVGPPSARAVTWSRAFGTVAVALGILTVALIVFALLQ